MDDIQLPWIQDKKIITEAYFEAINKNNIELFRIIKDHLKEVEPILPLIEFIIERLETVTDLIVNDKIWDAEIILRSAIETFVKLVFITTASIPERGNRILEYWIYLSEINSIKQSDQAKKNLKHFKHLETHNLANLPIILSEELEKELRKKWTKSERQQLEQKWSFTEIVNSLAKDYRGKPMELFETLSHGYRLSSHVVHGDETGILIIRERNNRQYYNKELAYFGHYLRLLSDVSVYCTLIGVECMNFLNLNSEYFFKNQDSLKDVNELAEKYHKELFQDSDYDNYRDCPKR